MRAKDETSSTIIIIGRPSSSGEGSALLTMAGRHFICPLPLVHGKESIAGRWPASLCGDEPMQ
jgi:hypothetical protein